MSAFFKKELLEAARTHKMTVLALVFLIFGVMSPFAAKFMPEILSAAMPEGMTLTLPAPTAIDSWAQFFKNISQMGLIVLVILYGGAMSGELGRGTLVPLIAKGQSRPGVICAKYLCALLLWTFAYLLCFLVTLTYTLYFWPGGTERLIPAVLGLWGFGALLLAALLPGGVVFKSHYASLLFVGVFVVTLFLLDLWPAFRALSPLRLTGGTQILSGAVAPGKLIAPAASALALVAALLGGAIAAFRVKTL